MSILNEKIESVLFWYNIDFLSLLINKYLIL